MKSPILHNIVKALEYIDGVNAEPHPQQGLSAFAILANRPMLERARSLYYAHDAKSLEIFDFVSRFRIVMGIYGEQIAVDLPDAPFSREKWAALCAQAQQMDVGIADDYLLDRIDTWILESYSLKGRCEAGPGDIVLDCGTFTGNTSLYFAQKVGDSGHVYGFEPMKSIFERYEKNMQGVTNVTPVNAAVSNKNGLLPMYACEAASQVCEGEMASYATDVGYGMTLDSFAEKQKLPRVDFIKMDVEGAEADALEGAANIIKKYTPRMALSAYHKELDIVMLPRIVSQINGAYKFALRHFSRNAFETVLYCYTE